MSDLLTDATRALREIDPGLSPVSPGYAEAIVLLASYLTDGCENAKTDDQLAALLGFDVEFVRTVGSRLRSSGVWNKDGLTAEARASWDDGTIFWLDVNIARGDMQVVGGEPGNRQYQLTESGLRAAADLVKKISH